MGIANLAKKWATKHLKLVDIDCGMTNAVISVDEETFKKLKEFYISEGGKNPGDSFIVEIIR